jgi:hypothetical protein
MTSVGDTALNEVFQGKEDRFHGITVDSSKESCDVSVFPNKLQGTILCRCVVSVSVSHKFYSKWSSYSDNFECWVHCHCPCMILTEPMFGGSENVSRCGSKINWLLFPCPLRGRQWHWNNKMTHMLQSRFFLYPPYVFTVYCSMRSSFAISLLGKLLTISMKICILKTITR